MANCTDPNNPCSQYGLPCEKCIPCIDCIQPEVVVIHRLPQLPECEVVTDALAELANPIPTCTVKIINTIVVGKSVTIVVAAPGPNIEYSRDNVSYQLSPTFNDEPCGERKYYARQRTFTACVASTYATISEDCECIPNWKPVNPPVPECQNGYIAIKFEDGCGNFKFEPTNTPCGGGCDETFHDSVPAVTDCINGKIYYRQENDCGEVRWRETTETCSTCTQPSVPANAQVTAATCNSSGQIQNNAAFSLGPVTGANKYGVSEGSSYTGPGYDSATSIASGGTISVTGLQGSAFTKQFVVRVFNGSNTCFVDRIITFDPVVCPPTCQYPSYTFSKTDPTCTSGASNNNGMVHLFNYANATRYQICIGSSFSCPPNYANATVISGSSQINPVTNIGFTPSEEYRDYSIRVYNGSQTCYTDASIRVYNPCYSGGGGCTVPTHANPVPSQATCSGTQLNNNASIAISSIQNANKYGYSVGSVYSGPDYDNALPVASGQINLINLAGSANDTTYVFRLFNGTNSCRKDITVTIPGKTCEVVCTLPTQTNKSGNAATCTGQVINSDASVSISGVTNMTRYGVSDGNTYTGPNYSGAIASVASTINVTNLAGSAQVQTKTIRIFNGSDNCYIDVTVTIPATVCAPSCTNPTFTISSVPPTQCTGEQSNADGKVIIDNIQNGSKYQVCIASTFNCTPNFANSPVISGAGPIEAANYIAFSAGESSKTVVVRVYNGSETCYTDHSVTIQNPCMSCCGMVINSVQLTNV